MIIKPNDCIKFLYGDERVPMEAICVASMGDGGYCHFICSKLNMKENGVFALDVFGDEIYEPEVLSNVHFFTLGELSRFLCKYEEIIVHGILTATHKLYNDSPAEFSCHYILISIGNRHYKIIVPKEPHSDLTAIGIQLNYVYFKQISKEELDMYNTSDFISFEKQIIPVELDGELLSMGFKGSVAYYSEDGENIFDTAYGVCFECFCLFDFKNRLASERFGNGVIVYR